MKDFAVVHIKAGNGGRGAISFFSNRKGPCGGKGGKGGDIILQGDSSLNNLDYFAYTKHFFAENGSSGKSNNTTGKNGSNIIIRMPFGTICKWNNQTLNIIDETKHTILIGGRGGLGNGAFKNSVNQIPRFSQPGEPGERFKLTLELKLIGNIGLIGAPNAGKSTLIGLLTNFKSEVGDYAFTTKRPWQGMLNKLCLVDLPGIIENAHIGKGMGLRFLRHAENCQYLFLIIDVTDNPTTAINMLLNEIECYNKEIINNCKNYKINNIEDINNKDIIEDEIDITDSEDIIEDDIDIKDSEDIIQNEYNNETNINKEKEIIRINKPKYIIFNKCEYITDEYKQELINQYSPIVEKIFFISALFEIGIDELKEYMINNINIENL